jgi:hypothetical protein
VNAFVPTHRVPPSGLDSWPRPDPLVAVGPHIDGGLEVQVVDRLGDWAKVAFNNGWTAWVDGRLLAGTRSTGRAPGLAALMADRSKAFSVGGALLVVISSLLPWLRGGASGNAFDVPIKFLLDYKTSSNDGIKVGWLLIVCSIIIVVAVVKNADPRIARGAGIGAIAIAGLYAIQLQRLVSAVPGASFTDLIGLGVLLAAAGGVLVLMK